MARKVSEIQSEMDSAYKAAFALDDAQMSKAGVWKLLRSIVALAIFTLETLFDSFKDDVTALAATTGFGKPAWWVEQMKSFQYGDILLESNGRLFYEKIDPTKQIIAKCSINEVDGIVKIKIAALIGGNLVIINDSDQRTMISSYVSAINPAGIVTQIVSHNADKLKFNIGFVFDGKLIQSDFETTVKNAIKTFLKDIEFDGKFKVNRFRDALELIPGMIDVYINEVDYKSPTDATWAAIPLNVYKDSISGYYQHMEDESTLTFIPQ